MIRKSLIFLVFFLSLIPYSRSQQRITIHKVEKGETLYKISQKYGVAVSEIMNYNPGLTLESVKTDVQIIIPQVVSSDNDSKEITGVIHKVKKKETLRDISKKYDVSIEELKILNPDLAPDYQLKKGMIINVSIDTVTSILTPTKKTESLSVAVVLPLTSQNPGVDRCLEFYRGFLMGASEMREAGRDITIYAYEEGTNEESLDSVLELVEKSNIQLLVGPLYFEHFEACATFTKKNNVKWLVPFSSKLNDANEHPYVYLMNPPDSVEKFCGVQLFTETFKGKKVVFVLDNEGKELVFMHSLRNHLVQSGFEIEDILSDASVNDIQKACSADKETVIVSPYAEKEKVTRLIDKLTLLKAQNPSTSISLLGYSHWLKWESNLKEAFCQLNTYLLSPYYFSVNDKNQKNFIDEYYHWFKTPLHTTTPKMALQGFDCAKYFISGIFKDQKDFPKSDYYFEGLQSNLRFEKISQNGGYANTSMFLIHYKTDGTVEKYFLTR